MLIEALLPLLVRFPYGDLRFEPRQPIELPDAQAEKLLRKVPDKVQRVAHPASAVVIEPAALHARPVYWQRVTGIVGPGQPQLLARVGCGNRDKDFWVIVQYAGEYVWVRSDMLRSRQQFETQIPVREVELIREPRSTRTREAT